MGDLMKSRWAPSSATVRTNKFPNTGRLGRPKAQPLGHQLYAAAGTIPSVRKGTPYPAEEAYLSSLYHGPTTADVLKYPQEEASLTTMELATQNLERLLCPTTPMTPEAAAAINRLQRLQSLRKSNTWGPDLIFKAFNDLDLALFDGKLRGHIQLRWKTEEEFTKDYPGRDDSWGMTQLRFRIRDHGDKEYFSYGADINLRSAKIFQGSPGKNTAGWDEMFGTLIHEMTHAYLRFTTRYSSSRTHLWCDADRCHGYGHGEHFQRCLRATDHRAAKVGLKGLLDSLEASIPESNDCASSVDSSIYDEGEYMNEETLNEAKAIKEAWRIGDMDEAESNQEVLDGMKEFMKMCPGGRYQGRTDSKALSDGGLRWLPYLPIYDD